MFMMTYRMIEDDGFLDANIKTESFNDIFEVECHV